MAVTAKWYGKNVLDQWGASPVNWVSDTIKVSLHANTSRHSREYWPLD